MGYTIKIEDKDYVVDQETLESLDSISVGTDAYHVLEDNTSHSIRLVEQKGKQITLEVNGNSYTCIIKDEYDQLVDQMGLSVVTSQKLSSIKAPMPGLILDIMVQPSDAIQEGDAILILEAMKMENVLKATGEGVVKSIEVAKGDAVEKGQVLIEME